MFPVFVILWVCLCFIPATIAKDKGLGFGVGLILGLLAGPVIGTLIVCVLPGSAPPRKSRVNRPRPTRAKTGVSRRPMMRK